MSPAAASDGPLTIALPKGRTLKPLAAFFARAGVTGISAAGEPCSLEDSLFEESRALVRRGMTAGTPVDFLLLKSDDIPTYVEHGTADLGACGLDILGEREADVYHPVDFGIGRCRLVVAGRVGDEALPRARLPRVATKYPRTAAAHFARQGVQVEVVNVQSSVELAPIRGLSDLIVDLVETGATLVQNGLEVKEEISKVSTVLVANRASYKLRADVIRPLVDGLRAALTP